MTDRKTTVHGSEHLRVDRSWSICQFYSSVNIYIWTLITLPLLFQFAKRNEKVMHPPVCIKFYIQPPSLLLSFSPIPPSNFPPPPPPSLQVIIAQSLRTVQVYCFFGVFYVTRYSVFYFLLDHFPRALCHCIPRGIVSTHFLSTL